VDGLGNTNTIKQIGELFGFHPLALEDVINVHQRAKVEPYGEHLFIVTRLVALTAEHLESEQISIFLGKDFVVTFQQHTGDCFDPVRERIRTSRGRIREAGADYLAYALIDAVIDSYFPVVEQFADHLDDLEEEVAVGQSPTVTGRIHGVRNDLLLLRRSIRPHRDALNELVRDQHPLIAEETRVFLRDCYDHAVQLIDLLEVYREMCADLRDYYLSLVSNRMNDVMKVLTIIATIFIPLSFVAGLYGMNFNTALPGNMPELNLPYGYVAAVSVMALIAFGMLVYFWRRGWIGPTRPPPGV
jgi:magnesium transporter